MRVRFDAASRLVSASRVTLVLSAALVASPVLATNYVADWSGAGDGTWTDPANWNFTPALAGQYPDNGADTFDVTLPTGPVVGVTIDLNRSITVNSLDATATNENVTVSSSGDFDLTIKNTLTWNAGTFSGPGTTIIDSAATANINLPAVEASRLNGRTLLNRNVVVMQAGASDSTPGGTLYLDTDANVVNEGSWTLNQNARISGSGFRLDSADAQVVNTGTIDIAGDGVSIDPLQTFSILPPDDTLVITHAGLRNAGLLVKSAKNPTTPTRSFVSSIDNTGTVHAQVGTLRVLDLTQTAGQTKVDANATLEVGTAYIQAGKLSGAGTIGDGYEDGNALVVLNGASHSITLAPGDDDGNAVGTLTSAAGVTLGNGVRLEVQIENASGTAGPDWDLLDVTNTTTGLSISNDSSDPIVVAVSALNLTGFTPTTSYEWAFAQAESGLLTGYDRSLFDLQVDTSGFGPLPSNATWDIKSNEAGNILYVTYSAVPEPASLGLVAVASTLLIRRRKH